MRGHGLPRWSGSWPAPVRIFLEQLESLPVAAWIQAGREADERRSDVIEARERLDEVIRETCLERECSAIRGDVQTVALRLRTPSAPMVGSYRTFEALRAQTAADYAAHALFLRTRLDEHRFALLVAPFAYLMKFTAPGDVDVERIAAWLADHSSVSNR